MSRSSFRLPKEQSELPLSLALGVVFGVGIFVLMALAQMLGEMRVPERDLDEQLIAFNPPDVVEIEEEPPPPEDEPPPELEEEPPLLSLDQLEIALNPGTGGALAGDFSLPTLSIDTKGLGDEFVDFSALDQTPRPIGVTGFNFPRRLLKKKAVGRIVLLLKLSAQGEVLDVQVDSSDLPEFDDFVVGQVKRWKFTPPTRRGEPVQAEARLPIPIQVN